MIEGEETHAELLRRYVKAWGRERDIPLSITSFSDKEDFRSMWEGQRDIDALLVDTHMADEDRKELSGFARKDHIDLAIIFTAGFAENGDKEPGSSKKSVGREKLFRCMDKVLYREGRRDVLVVQTKTGPLELAADRIMFVEAQGSGCMIEFCPQRNWTFQLECRDSLAALEEQLDKKYFRRCHRAYIVRLDKIRRVSRSGIELKNGSRIPVSRAIYGDLRQMLHRKREQEREEGGA